MTRNLQFNVAQKQIMQTRKMKGMLHKEQDIKEATLMALLDLKHRYKVFMVIAD